MSDLSNKSTQKQKKDSGMRMIVFLFMIALLLGIIFLFVYVRSERKIIKSYTTMQKIAPTLTIDGCVQENMKWYRSCDALQQLCDKSVSQMMRVCLVNGIKNDDCKQYGDDIYHYNFGAKECQQFLNQKPLKKACADTYQTVADFCKAVRKTL